MVQAAFSWALDEGADEVRVETHDKSDRQALRLGGACRSGQVQIRRRCAPRHRGNCCRSRRA
jgi:hypothetical protein